MTIELAPAPEFRPSQVRLWRAWLPLIDTFGQAETEFAAALMVIGCRFYADEWQPLCPRQIGHAMKAAGQPGGQMHHLADQAMIPRPDMRRLAADGFAVFLGDENGDDVPLRFTQKGYDMLRRTVAKPAP